MKPGTVFRAVLWLPVAMGAIGALVPLFVPWTDNNPPQPVANIVGWSCLIASSALAIVIALRRRHLLSRRPAFAVAVVFACLGFIAACRLPSISEDLAIYLLVVGSAHLVLVLAALVLCVPFAVTRSVSAYLSLIERTCLFSALLLASGSAMNAVWMRLVYDRLYFSQDTLVDFIPFIPFGQWALDREYGGRIGSLLGGASLWQVQLLWVLFAATAWIAATAAYRKLMQWLAA